MTDSVHNSDPEAIGVSLGYEPEEDWECYWPQIGDLYPVAGLKTRPPEGNWYANEARPKFIRDGSSVGVARAFRVRHTEAKETRAFQLGGGPPVVMAGTMRQFRK